VGKPCNNTLDLVNISFVCCHQWLALSSAISVSVKLSRVCHRHSPFLSSRPWHVLLCRRPSLFRARIRCQSVTLTLARPKSGVANCIYLIGATQLNASLMTISVIALLLPAAFHFAADASLTDAEEKHDILSVSHGVSTFLKSNEIY